ncbi:putative quinol monooxygenase [Patulibacter minatonensis]|uniref:putative quinol monooxygenase n=1 Tax=Patulibacter minatonensis TaxID=298163 RepID=UPI00068647BE|nr:antibiotic biosynthesis monooxygenase family protein [Patulibacter minatonensis]
MSVTSHFDLRVVPDRLDDALAVLRRILSDTRAFPGNRGVTLAQADGDPTHVIVIAAWDRLADHDAYLAWRSGAGAVPELPELLAGDPGGERFVTASSW